MTDLASNRLLSGRAWDDFCEQIRLSGHVINQFDELDPIEVAEWYRFMTRLMRNGLERFVENCEPERPRLRDASWRSSINFQSPDQDHYLAEFVDGSHQYRITGTFGSAPYFVLAAWTARQPANIGEQDWSAQGAEGLRAFNPAMLNTTSMLQSDELIKEADGSFILDVGLEKPLGSKNWLAITEDCVGLLVRVVYHRREHECPPTFSISRADGCQPLPLEPRLLSSNLAKVAQWTRGYAELVHSWWTQNIGLRPNRLRFSRKLYLSNGGVPDRHHGFGSWKLENDQAIVLTFLPPACDYWIFQLCSIWQENLDSYEDGQGYISKYRATYEPDGTVRIIISPLKPSISGNWIHPYGHTRGGWSLRVILTQENPPPIEVRLVPASELIHDGIMAIKRHQPHMTGDFED